MNQSVSESLHQTILAALETAGGWLGFDAFMQLALYAPGLGYYSGGLQKFGALPQSGSDFVTAPELSPLFGQCLADQAAQVLDATGTHDVYEFGAGSGALALQICERLPQVSRGFQRYFIIEISSELRARQQERLHAYADRITWLDAWPEQIEGVVIGNEVLDAMPVQLLIRKQGDWYERGVVASTASSDPTWAWQDRLTALRPPCEIPLQHDYLTEIHPYAESFARSLAERFKKGVALLIDYGFPEREYYHPQRSMGTLMTHQLHQSGTDPLLGVGSKDITAHVNFTGIAVAAQEAIPEMEVLGYTSQGRFLLNCGLLQKLELLPLDLRYQNANLAAKLMNEHEMGELFKVIAFGRGMEGVLMGFSSGDRSHTL